MADGEAKRIRPRPQHCETRVAKQFERPRCNADYDHVEAREILSGDRKACQPWRAPSSPTPDDLQHLMRLAAKYDYWIGSPAENAAFGISLP